MAKEKAKHDRLLCFLLAIIIVLIVIIGAGGYYFFIVDNEEKNISFNNSENITPEELSKEELDYFTEYFNSGNGIYDGFFIAEYKDIRNGEKNSEYVYSYLSQLLYPYMTSYKERIVNNEEMEDIAGGSGDMVNLHKYTLKEINEFLKKNTGYVLTDFEGGNEFGKTSKDKIIYSEKYNAYYAENVGPLGADKTCLSGKKEGNKYILEFNESIMTLNKKGDNYIIVSNILKLKDCYYKIRDCVEKAYLTKVERGDTTVTIENGKLYVTKNGQKNIVTTIKETPKYFYRLGEQTLETLGVITEEGTVYELDVELDSVLNTDKFKKIDIKGKVVDITDGEFTTDYFGQVYYVLDNGELINKHGKTHKEINTNRIALLSVGVSELLFVHEDYKLSYVRGINEDGTYDYDFIKDTDGRHIFVNQVFLSWRSWIGDGLEEYFIIDNQNRLLYFKPSIGTDNLIAGPYVISQNNSPVKNYKITEEDNMKILNVSLENDIASDVTVKIDYIFNRYDISTWKW